MCDYPEANSSIVYQENDGIAIGTAEFGGFSVLNTVYYAERPKTTSYST